MASSPPWLGEPRRHGSSSGPLQAKRNIGRKGWQADGFSFSSWEQEEEKDKHAASHLLTQPVSNVRWREQHQHRHEEEDYNLSPTSCTIAYLGSQNMRVFHMAELDSAWHEHPVGRGATLYKQEMCRRRMSPSATTGCVFMGLFSRIVDGVCE